MLTQFDPEKQKLIQDLLDQPILARLATANPKTCQPHVIPLWYLWDGENVWISGFSSTRKFRELLANPRCAILVEPTDPKEGKIQAVLFKGQAEIITANRQIVMEISTQIYLRYLGEEGIQDSEPQSWIHDPENLIAKLKPEKIFAW